ncbi:MAG: protocatechuate 3,4-dioxygenase subunit alpha [Rhodobacteraceae bacterium]|nr:protocatechuate 3,4-dioxygenase subunit alpha [Paracoccaceae bacterium]MCF8513824.1 protocatechuate 3,4-dioxygenase subunit alpha [Paracoccaceae bacterium]MCF8518068.1 protocatechuate 3,4-dioxygenase subunit alpha [Paracoccaceae bacterium]
MAHNKTQPLNYLRESASQTAGPYVHIGLAPGAAGFEIYERELGTDIAGPNAPGERVRIEGVVYDGLGASVKDVLIEVWQADAAGIYPHPEDPRHADVAPGFRGWGRVISDFDSGVWTLDTIKPGPCPGRMGRVQAPHLSLWIVSRGINIGLNTRLYFPEDTALHAADPILGSIEQRGRVKTLIATKIAAGQYRFDISLQGDDETVFMDI